MIQASVVGLFRTIAFILLFYYGFKFLAKYVFPIILSRYINKMQQNANQYTQETKVKEGTTTIDKKPQQTQSSSSVGEYIDFEEVDD